MLSRANRPADRAVGCVRRDLAVRMLVVWAVTARLSAILLVVAAAPSSAQTYPNSRITLVVGYDAGGTGDVIARIIGARLGDALGQPVIVENRSGASGTIAAQGVARSTPDGYTILVGQSAEIAINQHFMDNITYDPDRDFIPVALGGIVPLALVVPVNSPSSSLPELIKAANDPKGLLFASAGVGTPGHLAAELLKLKTHGNMTHVPYKGASPALNDLLGSHVDMYFSGLPAAMPLVRSGQLKLLAVSSLQRATAAPNTPTIAEGADISGFDITLWGGFFAPRGTPPEIVERLNREINTVLRRPDTAQKLSALGVEPRPLSPSEFAEFVKSESEKYAQIIKQGNLRQ
jgi:tripartite-type tricarboxylate transporter receptor subunit TctC